MILALGLYGGYRKVSPFFFPIAMKKLRLILAVVITLFLLATESVKADSREAEISAVPKFKHIEQPNFDYRVFTLRKFFAQHKSSLTPYSEDFIKTADYYDLDYRMVPAISGVESTFGKRIPPNSYNAYGWAGGEYR